MRNWVTKKSCRLSLFSFVGAVTLLAFLLVGIDGESTAAQSSVRYVKSNGMAGGACASWATACVLDYAMNQAAAGDELWLAAGVYIPTLGVGSSASFTLTNGVALYGGFAGTETARQQRDPAVHVVVLSGDAGIAGNSDDNANHVVTAINVDAATRIDGVTIRDGNAIGFSATGSGGGIYIYNGNLTIANVLFTNNSGQSGGGLYSRYGSPTLDNVQFIGNSASYGGGVYNYSPAMTLTNVIFRNNSVSLYGGGMYNNASNPVLTGALFEDNRAGNHGGALYSNNSNTLITTARFTSNYAASSGGAIYSYRKTFSLSDTLFMSNTSRSNGGSLYVSRGALDGERISLFYNSTRYNGGAVATDRSVLTMTHVTAAFNQAKYGGVFYNDTTTVTLANATFYSNSATIDGGAMFNDAAATTLDHLTAVGNAAEHYGGVLYTILEVPTVRNSILWGNTAEKGGAIIGTALFIESIVEGGCPVGVSCMHVHDADPLLGAPGNYGGAVDTIPVLTGSPAIDRATDFCQPSDARGVARPQGAACDLGAYETRGLTLRLVSGGNQTIEVYQPYPAPLVVSAASIEGHVVDGAQATFASPSSGAGTAPITQTAIFSGGQAAVHVTANSFPGEYSVNVSAPGSQPLAIMLDNLDTPVAGLQASHSGAAPVGQAVIFTATVQGGTNIVYAWEFGDGATVSTSENTLIHAYAAAGAYAVTVTASNEVASARLPLAISIYDVELAGLTAVNDGATSLGQTTQFQATTEAGTGLAYSWDFGDGATGAGQAPVHTYAAPGVYIATVHATNGVSAASAQTTVLVEQALVNVSLHPQGTVSGEVGRAVSFSVEVGAGQPTTLTWQFGDEALQGNHVLAAAEGSAPWTNIEHVYATPGAYLVVAHVANSVSQFDVSSAVEIKDVPINGASITWNGQLEVGQPINFLGQRVEGTSVSCIWDFEDSTPPISGCDVEHVYKYEGRFTIKLWMVNSIGVIVTRTTVEIVDPTPDPTLDNFIYLPNVRSQWLMLP
ncbi:MAG: PKD domain-containing protein [Caldilineaceae bacterium]|jgi:predicted outer membrane repeat protein|nr:PKD domain-containing protein [Caldilineaceae bacterium]